MTKSQLFTYAHSEARSMMAARKCNTYAEAFMYGLRRAHAKAAKDEFVLMKMAEPEMPKFVWLRGF